MSERQQGALSDRASVIHDHEYSDRDTSPRIKNARADATGVLARYAIGRVVDPLSCVLINFVIRPLLSARARAWQSATTASLCAFDSFFLGRCYCSHFAVSARDTLTTPSIFVTPPPPLPSPFPRLRRRAASFSPARRAHQRSQ